MSLTAPSLSPHKSLESPLIVYFSSVSENTHRFVEKLGMRAARIPVLDGERSGGAIFEVDEPYVLICPTYGGGKPSSTGGNGFVPKQVIKFLNNTHNRSLIRGTRERTRAARRTSCNTPLFTTATTVGRSWPSCDWVGAARNRCSKSTSTGAPGASNDGSDGRRV